MALRKSRLYNFSLIQVISAIFITITIMVIVLSVVSARAFEQIGDRFTQLSEQALPLSQTNASLTQNILKQIKQLNQAANTTENQPLTAVANAVGDITETNDQLLNELLSIAKQFNGVIPEHEGQYLTEQIKNLTGLSQNILTTQSILLEKKQRISQDISEFRYGLNSIGPEMNRISSFLVQGNPESTDAANRFSASANAMGNTFLVLMMQTSLPEAEKQYREMRNRLAGINLAYDDFAEWHPDISEFMSLTSSIDMVKNGFSEQGVLQQLLENLDQTERQHDQINTATQIATDVVSRLNTISHQAQHRIDYSASIVTQTLARTYTKLLIAGTIVVSLTLISWLSLRFWINGALNNIRTTLNALSSYNLTEKAKLIGPRELKDVAGSLNQVIDSTHASLSLVTRNCETLYQTAEISHDSADNSSQTLQQQNGSLMDMVSTVTQLEASIKEISSVTNETYNESQVAAEHSLAGLKVVELNRQSLETLEITLNGNEASMVELDKRVKQIREMVDLISGIADNTNLLALNAAIEAARAGDQGRGFAVVADEVRKLASETSDQTTSIREKMNQLVAAAEDSRTAVLVSRNEMTQALKSGHAVKTTFEKIEKAMNHTCARVEQISAATEQQQKATEGVSEAIHFISSQAQDTQLQLKAMVESAESVADIAGHQQAMLHKYKTA